VRLLPAPRPGVRRRVRLPRRRSAPGVLRSATYCATIDFHAGAPNAFESVRFSIFSLLLLSFTGDFDADNYPTHVDQALLVTYLLVTVIVQLNILIAIVSDSYDAARASGNDGANGSNERAPW